MKKREDIEELLTIAGFPGCSYTGDKCNSGRCPRHNAGSAKFLEIQAELTKERSARIDARQVEGKVAQALSSRAAERGNIRHEHRRALRWAKLKETE